MKVRSRNPLQIGSAFQREVVNFNNVPMSQSPSDRVCLPTQENGVRAIRVSGSQSPSDRVCLPTKPLKYLCFSIPQVAIPFRSGLPSNLFDQGRGLIPSSCRNPLQIGSAFQLSLAFYIVNPYTMSQSPSDRVCLPTEPGGVKNWPSLFVAIPFRSGLPSNTPRKNWKTRTESQSPSDRVCLPT